MTSTQETQMSLYSHNKCGKITIKHWELDLFFILYFTSFRGRGAYTPNAPPLPTDLQALHRTHLSGGRTDSLSSNFLFWLCSRVWATWNMLSIISVSFEWSANRAESCRWRWTGAVVCFVSVHIFASAENIKTTKSRRKLQQSAGVLSILWVQQCSSELN